MWCVQDLKAGFRSGIRSVPRGAGNYCVLCTSSHVRRIHIIWLFFSCWFSCSIFSANVLSVLSVLLVVRLGTAVLLYTILSWYLVLLRHNLVGTGNHGPFSLAATGVCQVRAAVAAKVVVGDVRAIGIQVLR